MPLARHIPPQGRHGRRRLDPAHPLFVQRRIPAGVDADGKPAFLLPGEPFDASHVSKQRLGSLFRSRYISHEPPRAMRSEPAPQGVAAPAVVAPPAVAPPAATVIPPRPAPTGKRPRAGA